MSRKRASIVTREFLKQVPLPTHQSSYTVISHETVMVNVLEQLKLKGFKVESERLRSNASGEIASGVYNLTYGNDPELGMIFAWTNSYDKSTRFKSAVGGFVKVSDSCIISDFNWSRKHTGTADQEMIAQVNNQIVNGQIYYDQIVKIKEEMKNTMIDNKIEVTDFLGKAFFIKQLFSKEQIGIVRDEMLKPSFDYNSDPESLWTYYNHMLIALKKAHPRTWMDEQRDLHKYIVSEFGLIGSGIIAQIQNKPAIPVVVTTAASTTNESMIITIEPTEVPVHIFSEQEDEKPVGKMNLEEFAEIINDKKTEEQLNKVSEDLLIKGESKFKTTINGPDLEFSDITPEEQLLIDERIAAMSNPKKTKVKPVNLNLPD